MDGSASTFITGTDAVNKGKALMIKGFCNKP